MQLTKCIAVVFFLLALFALSCRSQKEVVEKETQADHEVIDREIQRIETTTKVVTTPQTTAIVTITEEQIANLPVGAKYQAKDGNSTGTVEKTKEGIKFTANCDSLYMMLTYAIKEVNRFKSENTALVTQLKEQKTIEVNVLTRWQLFEIWGFRILSSIAIVFIFNKFNIWRKLLNLLLKLLR